MLHLLMMQLEKLVFIAFNKKYDVFYTSNKWKYLVENETRKRLKCLRSDNGREYCSKEFDDFFSYHGIRREKIVPGTP
jgi:transposase InsO family protein